MDGSDLKINLRTPLAWLFIVYCRIICWKAHLDVDTKIYTVCLFSYSKTAKEGPATRPVAGRHCIASSCHIQLNQEGFTVIVNMQSI